MLCVCTKKISNINVCCKISGCWLEGVGSETTQERHEGDFWGLSIFLFLDLGPGYMDEFKFVKIHLIVHFEYIHYTSTKIFNEKFIHLFCYEITNYNRGL